MRTVVVIIAFALGAPSDGEEPPSGEMHAARDSFDDAADKSVGSFLDRMLKASSIHHADLDYGTLGKSAQLALPASRLLPRSASPGIMQRRTGILLRSTSSDVDEDEKLWDDWDDLMPATSKTQKQRPDLGIRRGSQSKITTRDRFYLKNALFHAAIGARYTFPNPAVGCILVESSPDNDEEKVLGSGFHPKAGMPHAEVFALFEACGAVPSGVEAASSVVPRSANRRPSNKTDSNNTEDLRSRVYDLLREYTSEGGAQRLFEGCCKPSRKDKITTAYVTLEPCCHYGKTPPCAMSLVHAGVTRVVVACGDPNPRVDGGGVKLLRGAGITVDKFRSQDDKVIRKRALATVGNFVKRATRSRTPIDYRELLQNKHRRALQRLAVQMVSNGKMSKHPLSGKNINEIEAGTDMFQKISPSWLEDVDTNLWLKEFVQLDLGGVADREDRKKLGKRIADELGAYPFNTLGTKVTLYRPGLPPSLDLNQVANSASKPNLVKGLVKEKRAGLKA